jgi:hypothetical protein
MASAYMAMVLHGNNLRNDRLAALRALHVGAVLPLLRDTDRGLASPALFIWRLRCGLSRLLRAGSWQREERGYLVRTLEAASHPLDRDALLELCAWLEERIRRDGDHS